MKTSSLDPGIMNFVLFQSISLTSPEFPHILARDNSEPCFQITTAIQESVESGVPRQ